MKKLYKERQALQKKIDIGKERRKKREYKERAQQ